MNRLFGIATYAGAAVLMGLALFTVADVVMRYFFNSPIRGTFELSGLILSVVVAAALVAATAKEEHISVDALYEKMAPLWRRILDIAAVVTGIVALSLLIWQGFSDFMHYARAGEYTDMLRAPVYPFRLILVLGFALCLVAMLRILVRLIRRRSTSD